MPASGYSSMMALSLGECLASSASVSARELHLREGQEPDDRGPGVQVGKPLPQQDAVLQFDLSLGELTTLRECTSERDVGHRGLRNLL